jgi:hypothetical protein
MILSYLSAGWDFEWVFLYLWGIFIKSFDFIHFTVFIILSCVLKQTFLVAQKIYKTRRYNARVKSHYFTKAQLRHSNILKYFRCY